MLHIDLGRYGQACGAGPCCEWSLAAFNVAHRHDCSAGGVTALSKSRSPAAFAALRGFRGEPAQAVFARSATLAYGQRQSPCCVAGSSSEQPSLARHSIQHRADGRDAHSSFARVSDRNGVALVSGSSSRMVGRSMAQEHRIASLATAAALLPIFEAIGQDEFVGPALDAKLQFADWTTHRPSTIRLVLPARGVIL